MEQEVQQVETKDNELEFSRCLIALMKGVVEQESQPGLWNSIVNNQARIEEYVQKISLRLYLDKVVGYAYLRQVENENLPRIVNRHQLSFGLSMLLVTLRKSLGDYDAASGDSFYVIKKSDILLKLKGFFPQAANETKYVHEIERYIKRACEMGFLVPVKGERHLDNAAANLINDEAYEVKELIRSFITAAWLKSFEERISDYINYANGEPEEESEENPDDEIEDNSKEKPQDITTTLELDDTTAEDSSEEIDSDEAEMQADDDPDEQFDDTVMDNNDEITENDIEKASEEDTTDGLI